MTHSRKLARCAWPTIWCSTRETVERLVWLILLPFRLIGIVWRSAVAFGIGIVRFSVNLCAAVLGLTFALFVGYCLARALLYPLF